MRVACGKVGEGGLRGVPGGARVHGGNEHAGRADGAGSGEGASPMKLVTPAMAGFTEDGRRYVVRDVERIPRADGYLHNDSLYIQADQRGNVSAHFNQPQFTRYSESLRCFYVRDEETGEFWSAPFDPVQAPAEAFAFSVGLDDLRWTNLTHGIETFLRLFVPRGDNVEAWAATLANRTRRTRRLSVFSYFPIGSPGPLYQRGDFDPNLNGIVFWHFPSHSDADEYWALKKRHNFTFCLADRRPGAYETTRDAFAGPTGLHSPGQLLRRRLTNRPCFMDPCAAVLQFPLVLKPGKAATLRFLFGPARDRAHIRRLRTRYLRPGGFERAGRAVEAFRKAHAPSVLIETPDLELNHFINHWLPKQTIYCGYNQRMSLVPCVRNCLQDAMGLVFNAPARARELFLKVFEEQADDGALWMSVMLAPLSLGRGFEAKHRDKNVWSAFALQHYLLETGDFSLLREKVRFKDKPGRQATVFEHVCLGLDWLLKDRTPRGLNLLGEGDWCDPLNMAGIRMKGESVWLSQALVHSLDMWADVAAQVMGERAIASRYRREAVKLRRAIDRYAWDGGWYAAGFTDDGRPFGVRSEREGRLWLNAQSWALIGGVATGRRAEAVIRNVGRLIESPNGPVVCGPAYTAMREDIGRVTIKTPGTNENGSFYCHAGSFWAYALYLQRRPDLSFRALRRILPGGRGNPNTVARAGQLPLYIPNMFRGPGAGWTAGQSSHSPGTGTAAWFYRLAVGHLLGVRAEPGGLRLDPQLPRAWRRARVWRCFRDAEFEIVIRRDRRARKPRVVLDGQPLDGNLVPLQPAGSRHRVTVTIR